MKKIEFYKGMSLGQWVEENDLSQLERDIRCNCEAYLAEVSSPVQDARDLTRNILISIRTRLNE